MKFKFKINENTTLNDVKIELNVIKSANVKEIPLNHLFKIIEFIGAKQVTATGSSVRFEHYLLKDNPFFHGYFQVHKVHGGGDKDKITMIDFKKYIYPVLIIIIELKEKK